MIFIDPNVDETFFNIAIFPRNSGMSDSLSSLLVFITIMYLVFTSVNGSNSCYASSKSLSIGIMCSMVVGCCFLVGLNVVVSPIVSPVMVQNIPSTI